jgi:hypothetical protein
MSERPLERLNYFNGQRLQAADFKLEQDYHIRIRRWLNRSLYSSGIASGLNVYAIKDQPRVRVTPGLAIDHLGREIILLEEQIVDVVGGHHAGNGKCRGPYLTIRYQEDVVAEQDGSCLIGGHPSNRSAWSGPARILSNIALELNPALPNEESGKIPLACLRLSKGCASVDAVDLGVRRNIGQASANKVKQYALEGERHIDAKNAGRIQFHIRGQQPTSVVLYLRAEKFSTLFYSELGHHDHKITVNVNSVTIPQHHHTITADPATGGTGPAGEHTHNVSDVRANISGALNTPPKSSDWGFPPFVFAGTRRASLSIWASLRFRLLNAGVHSHSIPLATNPDPQKTIPLSGTGSADPAGVVDEIARPGAANKALTFVDDLQVYIGRDPNNLVRVTDDILRQLIASQPSNNWDKLGDGKSGHRFANEGSGEIKLHYLPGVTFSEGEYIIELRVTSGGGRVHFNLYVE